MLLWAGVLFVAAGLSIVVLEAGALRKGVATSGRLVGWAQRPGDSGPMYHAVVEFVDLGGRKRLSESAVGSGVPLGRIGDAIRVVLHTEDAEHVTIDSRATYVIGVVLALLGALSCGIFFLVFRADLFSVFTALAVSGLIGFKLYTLRAAVDRSLAGRRSEGRGIAAAWAELKKKAIDTRTIDPDACGEIPWADAEAVGAAARRQQRMNRFAWPVLLLGGLGLVLLAQHLHRTTSEFLARAVGGSGRVVDLAASDAGADATYAAIVEFEERGERHRFKDSVGANPPMYRAGDVVAILYLPEDPRRARIDRGVWNRATPPLVGALGALLAIAGLWLGARASRRADPSAAFSR